MIFLLLSVVSPVRYFSFLHSTSLSTSPKALSLGSPVLPLAQKCNSIKHLKEIQAQMLVTGLILDPHAASQLISFCAISARGYHDYCFKILAQMTDPGTFSYNLTIRAFLDGGKPKDAISLYKRLLLTGACPDNYTYPLLFKACALLSSFRVAGQLLGHVVQLGFDSNLIINNAVIHMFALSGELDCARQVFETMPVRDVVSWNSMIKGYIHNRKFKEVIKLFEAMNVEGVKPDEVTMIGVISCSGKLNNLEFGKQCHGYIKENKLNFTVELYNAVMDMYIKCGSLDSARQLFNEMPMKSVSSWTTIMVGYLKSGRLDVSRKLFNEMPERDIVTWNAMITGYVHFRRGKEALGLFQEMQTSSVKPNEITIVSLLTACALLGALDVGLWAHHYINIHKIPLNVEVGTALVDMYAKCGNIQKSTQVFIGMLERNLLSWTAMIGGFAMHGHGQEAINCFRKMTSSGLEPDDVTFLEVLSACCHAGLVEEGRLLFSEMISEYHISPNLKHYSCMVDILGRAGLLKEAEDLIKSMPMKPDAVVWGALFFASKTHGNIRIGEWAAGQLLQLDPEDSGIYVLLSNMYVEANMSEEARNVRKMMRERGVEKTPGCSLIEVNGIVHEFIVRDRSHQQREDIYDCLIQLTGHLELSKDSSSNLDG